MWEIQFLLVVVMCIHVLALDSRNIGTTLFEPADLIKKCWGTDTMGLLDDRILADELLPEGDRIPQITSKYVLSLMEYIFLAMETVRHTMCGYRLHSMSLACADVFGGFIYSAVLPRAKMEYYAGNLPYEDMRTLYDILSTFQTLLRKNNRFWKAPDAVTDYPMAEAIQIPSKSANECNKLLTFPRNDPDSFVIPIPFIDNKFKPTTVAVPFKQGSLYNLEAPYSAMIVAKYYVTSMKCLKEKSSQQDEVNGFCEYFYVWLIEDVLPLLHNEPWYEAFGGVFRILENMKMMGIAKFQDGKFLLPEHKTKYNKPGSINIDHYSRTSQPPPRYPPPSQETSPSNVSNTAGQNVPRPPHHGENDTFELFGENVSHETMVIVIVAVGTAVTMWMLTLLLLLCCRCCKCANYYNVFVSFFYMLKDSLQANSSIKTAEDVEQPRPQPLKGNLSEASSAGPAVESSTQYSFIAAPSFSRPLIAYEKETAGTQTDGDESTETTTDTDDDEYFQGSSVRKITSS